MIGIMTFLATLGVKKDDEKISDTSVEKRHTLKQVTSFGSRLWGI